MFANSQRDDWNREVAAYDALAATGNDLAPELLGVGPLWVATEWLDLVTAESADAADDALNIASGHSLTALHVTPTRNMPSRSMPKRLEGWLAGGSETCPAALLAKVREVIEPLASLCLETSFTHGDWGSANVLVRSDSPGQIAKIIDFEDSHRGDPAEDFKWQLIEGPPWTAYQAMASAYREHGGSLGPNASERLIVTATEWCLDVLTWDAPNGWPSTYRETLVATLDAFVCGNWPEAH